MPLVVLLSADGAMSPPFNIEGEEKDTVTMRLCLVKENRFKEIAWIDFKKTEECVPHEDGLVSVYKEVRRT